MAVSTLLGSGGGVVTSGDYAVTEHVAANMSVNVAAGKCWVPGTSTAAQSQYFVYNDAVVNPAITASDVTNPRIDKIVLRIKDSAYAGVGDEAVLEVVAGTAEAGATLANRKGAAATPASSLVLAYVLVPAKATSIVAANIENVATQFSFAGAVSQKSIIAAEQERVNAAFGTLPTPDEVIVTLPENGLIAVAYQAQWASTQISGEAGKAALFLGANQLKIQTQDNTGPVVQEASTHNAPGSIFQALSTGPLGLATGPSVASSVNADVTTGQILGWQTVSYPAAGQPGSFVLIFAAAGTYKISVQFKATSGGVKAKNRKLWAWVVA